MNNGLFQPGDIFACYGTDVVSRGISLATMAINGPWGLNYGPAHVAISVTHNSEQIWVESTTLSKLPCIVTRRENPSGSQAHFPADRIQEYVGDGGKVEIYRLNPVFKLDPMEVNLLSRLMIHEFVMKQVPYDMSGAIMSGTRLLRLSSFLVSDTSSLFCSELIAAVLMRLGRLGIKNPTRYNPARLLRELVRTGVYYLERTEESS